MSRSLAISQGRTSAALPVAPDREAIPFARILGPAAWARLPAAVRTRFSEHATVAVYPGVMDSVDCNWLGWTLAQLCRVIGTPLPPWRARNLPCEVRLAPAAKGTVWERLFRLPGGRRLSVRSVKRYDGERLMECVGGGVGMDLDVYERNGALCFASRRYFLEIAGIRLTLPEILTPGRALVVHEDLGGQRGNSGGGGRPGRFRFTLTMTHPWFGRSFYQDGVFEDEGEKS